MLQEPSSVPVISDRFLVINQVTTNYKDNQIHAWLVCKIQLLWYILKFENPSPFSCIGVERRGDWSSFWLVVSATVPLEPWWIKKLPFPSTEWTISVGLGG